MVGKAGKPRCFNGLDSSDQGFVFDYFKKGGMNKNIFFNWLKRFDQKIGITPRRKALLFTDNKLSICG